MLQQTQVATVRSYFERFVAALPTLEALAAAPEDEVLRLWEGLGYYRRARQLHRAAKIIVEQFEGVFPETSEELRTLPGVGRYTAGAILSIAFDQRQPILEANTIRLYSRLMCLRGPTSTAEATRELWAFAESILPRSRCGAFNQALMELGATVCTPRDPRCDQCPVALLCPTRERGLQQVIPAPPPAKKYEESHEACVVIWRRSSVLIRRCAEGERWAGLWDFPRFPLAGSKQVEGQVMAAVRQLTGMTIDACQRMVTMKHGVTRFRITLECFEANWRGGSNGSGEMAWVKPAELQNYALGKTARRVSHLLNGNQADAARLGKKIEGQKYARTRRSPG